jgi:PQQ-dependent catabolism-associated CXXCW motif protein
MAVSRKQHSFKIEPLQTSEIGAVTQGFFKPIPCGNRARRRRRPTGLRAVSWAIGLIPLMLIAEAAAAGGDGANSVPEPTGYRMDDYRAPTPSSIAGGTTITTAALRDLIAEGDVALIDVLPALRRPDNLPAGTLWIPQERRNIPGSIWLPDVGHGAISPEIDAYFRRNLARLSNSARDRRLVIYCLADCWMSWNAAKRAIGYGYSRVYWYPDGTDGWTAAGLPTEPSEPVPMPGS